MTTVTEPDATQETLVDVPLAALRGSLEAVLMVADQPLDAVSLATAVGYPVEDVVSELQLLAEEYAEQGRGFELRNVAGGWRYYTREEYAAVVEAFVLEGQQARLTQAALETLAVVAYKQPVSRARVSAIRGVNVDGVMRTLLTRGLVEEAGEDQSTGAHLYRTSSYFLERIGVESIDELPELAPYLPDLADMEDQLEALADPPAPGDARAGAQHRTRRRHRAHMTHPGLDDDGLIRLQKLLAQSGVASRRRCEELMLAGLGRGGRRGGHPARHQGGPAHRRDPGRRQAAAADLAARLPRAQQAPRGGLHDVRPRGPAHAVRRGRRPAAERLFHVGRLDTDTSGLLILTNDGDFAQRLAHPSYEVDKTYVAEVTGEVTKATLRKLLDGVTLDDGPVTVSRNRIVQHGTGKTIVELVIHEGRNKIVRRLLEHVGHPVTRLTRTRIGPVRLGQLKSGELRDLTLDELGDLLDTTEL